MSLISRCSHPLLIWLLIGCSVSSAQSQNYRFDRLAAFEELSQSIVTTIDQDSLKLLWFGTDYGLLRYDGRDLTNFIMIGGDTASYQDNVILDFVILDDNTFWIATNRNGLFRFNGSQFDPIQFKTDSATTSISQIRKLAFIDNRHLFLGGSKDVYHFDLTTDTLKRIKLKRRSNGDDILVNRNHIYIGGGGGLQILNRQTLTQDTVVFREMQDALKDDYVLSIQMSFDNRFFIGTEDGLYIFAPDGRELRHYVSIEGDPTTLPSSAVNNVIFDSGQRVWIATNNGLTVLNEATGKLASYDYDPNDVRSVGSDFIQTLYLDHTNNLWIGTWGGGVNRLNRYANRFDHYQHDPRHPESSLKSNIVWDFSEDRDGNIWIATESGTSIFDPHSQSFSEPKTRSEKDRSIISSGLYTIETDQNGFVWIGTQTRGIYKYDPDRYSLREMNATWMKETYDGTIQINLTAMDPAGRIWVGTSAGLGYFSSDSNRFVRVAVDTTTGAEYNREIVAVAFDSSGVAWVGLTEDGITRVDLATDSIQRYRNERSVKSIISDEIMSIHVDNDQQVWVCTQSGISILKEGRVIGNLGLKEGLPTRITYGVLKDVSGYHWISTHNGLVRYHMPTQTMNRFSVDDGLQDKEFNQGSIYKDSNDYLYFGGINGFNVINPRTILINDNQPNIVITEISSGAFLRRLVPQSEISLPTGSSGFEIALASLDYSIPEKNRYRLIIQGRQFSYDQVQTRNRFTVFNIPPGEYSLIANGTNNDGIWSDKPVTMKLIVPISFFESWVFYLLLVVVAIALIYLWQLGRLNQMRKHQSELEAVIDQKTRDLNQSIKDIERMYDFVRKINIEFEFERIIDVALKQSVQIPAIQRGSVLAKSAGTDKMKYRGAIGWNFNRIKKIEFTPEEVEEWVSVGSDEILPDVFLITDFSQKPTVQETPKATMVIRIHIENEVEGYIFFDNLDDKDAFSKLDLHTIEHLKEHILTAFNKSFIISKLKHLNMLKNELLGMAAHDIRGPLSQISGYAEIVQFEIERLGIGGESIKELTDKIINASGHLNDIVGTFLNISAIESGKLKLHKEKVNIHDIIGEAKEINLSRAMRKDILIQTQPRKDMVLAKMDRGRMIEVMDNLIGNAIKYSNQNGVVDIWVDVGEKDVTYHVKDDGVGMTEEQQKRLFDSFESFKKVTSRDKSTGLGLAIVKKIIELHDGHIWVESKEGAGTTISFSIPRG